ncbi:G5 domain-containing protein, partial [Streptococcus sp. S784/96/1]|uniref:G5 domain-containing protein n=1 Tax=Streptococcus sp. S784/96/1 TaxID=2653499 RepID=UPI001386CCF7
GTEVLKTPAVAGKKVVTTTYSLNPQTGEVTSSSSEQVQPGQAAVYRRGTKKVEPTVEVKTESIPVTTTYVADETLAYGERQTQPGTAGVRTITITDGQSDGGKITTAMVPTVITVGTKPTVVESVVAAPSDKVYEDDASLAEGTEVLKTPAVAGKKVVTTTYSLNPQTGEVTSSSSEQVQPGQAAVYRRGTKKVDTQPTVEVKTEEIPVTTTYVADETLAYGERQTQPGTAGILTITITDGQSDGGKITTAMVPTVITVGTKPTVVESVVAAPSDKVYEDDASLAEGTEVLKTPAVAGKKVVTTTYSLNPQTGEVTSSSSEQVQPGQAAVYRRGTKKVEPTVEVKTESIPVTTTYVADETLAYGERQTQPGTAGVRTITITDGQSDGGKITTAMVPTVITVGTKPTVVESVVAAPSDKVYEDDASLAKGTEVLKTPAVAGKKVVTTTYSLNPQTGEVTSSSSEQVQPGQAAVYRRGTKKADTQSQPTVETPTSTPSKPASVLPNTGSSSGAILNLIGLLFLNIFGFITFRNRKSKD